MEPIAEEIKRLRGCINNLISVLALPAIWNNSEPSQIVSTLLDVMLGMLRLDFVYARLSDAMDGSPIEFVRVAQPRNLRTQPQEVGRVLDCWLTDFPPTFSYLALSGAKSSGRRGGLSRVLPTGTSG